MNRYQKKIIFYFLIAIIIHGFFFLTIKFQDDSKNVIQSTIKSTQIFFPAKKIQVKKEIKKEVIKKEILSKSSDQKIKKPKKEEIKKKPIENQAPKKSQTKENLEIDPQMEEYIKSIIYLLNRNKKYPKISRINDEEGLVKIELTLNREGKLISSNIKEKSNYYRLDDAALRTVESIGTYPKIYSSFPDHEVSFIVPIFFKIKN